jgi:hypothetical protein
VQIAEPMGLDVRRRAGTSLRRDTEVRGAQVLGKGYSPVDYTLLCYGGGGPLHVAGYTAGVPYRDVLVPAWAAGFSACARAATSPPRGMTIDMLTEPGADEDEAGVGIYGRGRRCRGA